jgi:hypothetical protein
MRSSAPPDVPSARNDTTILTVDAVLNMTRQLQGVRDYFAPNGHDIKHFLRPRFPARACRAIVKLAEEIAAAQPQLLATRPSQRDLLPLLVRGQEFEHAIPDLLAAAVAVAIRIADHGHACAEFVGAVGGGLRTILDARLIISRCGSPPR